MCSTNRPELTEVSPFVPMVTGTTLITAICVFTGRILSAVVLFIFAFIYIWKSKQNRHQNFIIVWRCVRSKLKTKWTIPRKHFSNEWLHKQRQNLGHSNFALQLVARRPRSIIRQLWQEDCDNMRKESSFVTKNDVWVSTYSSKPFHFHENQANIRSGNCRSCLHRQCCLYSGADRLYTRQYLSAKKRGNRQRRLSSQNINKH